jgi:hypothetical protein
MGAHAAIGREAQHSFQPEPTHVCAPNRRRHEAVPRNRVSTTLTIACARGSNLLRIASRFCLMRKVFFESGVDA